jgi:putative SOS response-associated peptidase YedK
MCYHGRQTKTIEEVAAAFRIETPLGDFEWQPSENINGFSYPHLPILHNETPGKLVTGYTWGFLPTGKQQEIRKNMLNARIETIDTKPSFHDYVQNRCCIIMDGYFDWHWEDPEGKKKTKHVIHSADSDLFALAGIWNRFIDGTGTEWKTFSICTTLPNPAMKYVHNRKSAEGDERMPVMLRPGDEAAWLDNKNHHLDFAYLNYRPNLITFTV